MIPGKTPNLNLNWCVELGCSWYSSAKEGESCVC
ncbi:hypothetical protein COLO4_25150 [Corchorus olitorius]|uniref:Uncharacterized protein n=1 Tax=Corchorus olitorius TaxID=93759 RepID=A0A1R3I4G3_9ROSI|nr:hypothetical protein COLO4_25150 [Corchorus olitorius]